MSLPVSVCRGPGCSGWSPGPFAIDPPWKPFFRPLSQVEEMPALAVCGFPCWCRALQLDSLPQGTDPSPKPLIIGPEEDYDPGYFNNEVPVPWVLFSLWLCRAISIAGVGRGEAATAEEPGETTGRPQPSSSLCLPE